MNEFIRNIMYREAFMGTIKPLSVNLSGNQLSSKHQCVTSTAESPLACVSAFVSRIVVTEKWTEVHFLSDYFVTDFEWLRRKCQKLQKIRERMKKNQQNFPRPTTPNQLIYLFVYFFVVSLTVWPTLNAL